VDGSIVLSMSFGLALVIFLLAALVVQNTRR
jgi:ABC-type nickel/cobalt efflux system permease component RcnA